MSNKDFLERAQKVFVGGVNSPVRSFLRVGGNPIIAKRADGAFIEDSDGNKYIDMVMSYGPHLFGHNHSPITEALAKCLRDGLSFGVTGEREVKWGEKLVSFLPAGWKVRALSSGTEVCMTAVRLARGKSGRNIIVKCSGHYHGHVDSLLFDAGSGVATLSQKSIPDSDGLPQGLENSLKAISFNNVSELEKVFADFGNDIAGIILEPVMGNMGVVLPTQQFLERARALTSKHGSLLIFDEVMTGFRVAKNSSFGRFGITPDLICFGKIVGGGLPLAALAGDQQIMELLAPMGKVYQAGTLSGNPMGVTAGLAMLDEISSLDPYKALEDLGKEIETTLTATAKRKEIPLAVVRCGSMMSGHFRNVAPQNAAETRDIDNERFKKFFWSALKNGIMLPPSPFEAYFLSYAHLKIKDQLLAGLEKALKEI